MFFFFFFFSSRRRHTRSKRDWSSDVCSSDLTIQPLKKSSQEKPQTNDTLPLIISQVRDVEVVKATLKNKGTSDVYAVLEIKNNSDKAIVAVSVEIGKSEEASGITLNGFKEGNEPP